MQSLHDSTGSESAGPTPGPNGNVGQDPGLDAKRLKDVVTYQAAQQANSIPLKIVMARYGYHIDEQVKKTTCPFHAKGRERSPSFWWYPDTNRFKCYGCGESGDVVGFVALHDNIKRGEAAFSIIGSHGDNIDLSREAEKYVYEDIRPIMNFSDAIRLFNQSHMDDPEALAWAEKLCFTLDKVRAKCKVIKLKEVIENILSKLEK